MALKNKKFLYFFLYLLSFGLALGILILVNKIEFIPLINNLTLGLNFLIFLGLQIFSISKILNIKFNKFFKIFTGLVLIGILLFSILYLFLASAFSGKEDRNLIYNGNKYYVLNVGWMDPIYEVYRKNFITMDKLDEKKLGQVFSDLSKVKDENQREILRFLIYGREDFIEENHAAKENLKENHQIEDKHEEKNKEEDKNEFLKNFKLEDAIKIENSDYGILEVDHAGARSRWFFVKILGDEMKFISELEETSPGVSGKVDKKGNIYLKFTDVNKNETHYISRDGGKTFKE